MKKSVFIRIILMCGVLLTGLVLWMIFRPTGTEEFIEETRDAYILLPDGQKLDCTVRFSGTLYIDSRKVKSNQFSGGYYGGIWINDEKVNQYYVFEDTEQPLILADDNCYLYLNKEMDIFVARVQASRLDLEIEEQPVYVVLKQNTPEQYEPIISAIEERVKLDQSHKNKQGAG